MQIFRFMNILTKSSFLNRKTADVKVDKKNFKIILDGIIAFYWNLSEKSCAIFGPEFSSKNGLAFFVCMWNSNCQTINKHDFVK